ncbi:hypothetical protein C2845_PM18G03560 [Panicum miliaceum]|uniref:RING-type domain-containing protein n=1 Tax=Panicum miliaceum TaxID=4540 RepID=A0A3L6PFY8_PANMI|nr:hypothetical protein C2845_PM18G03560 [Panicum miliaceum]
MMDWDDVFDWIAWGLLVCSFLAVLAVALTVLVVVVHRAIRYLQRFCCCFGRGRRSGKAPPLFIEELLESIPDVAYQALPDAGGDDRDSCVICVTPYEAGEACSVLPGCTHIFHKPWVASWLRKKNTCPLCRATVGGGVPAHPPVPPRQANVVNAAENAV